MRFILQKYSILRNVCIRRKFSTTTTETFSDLVRSIIVRTCVRLYPRLHYLNPRLYPANCPTDGLELTVNYLDTGITNPATDKVILAVPGAAGNYTNFSKIITHFRESRVRVIAPNLPDFSHTRSSGGIFWHSTVEKVAFLKDFLREIGVEKIDCVLGHSMAMHSILGLCEEPGNLSISSIALFSPQPLYDLDPSTAAWTQKLLFTFRSELWFSLLNLLQIHKWSWIHSYYFTDLNNFLLFWMPSCDTETAENLPRRIYKLRKQSNIKVSIVYGSNERLVTSEARKRFYEEFGIEKVEILDSGKKQEILGTERIQAFVIEGGGHFAYAQFPNETNRILENLLDL